MKEFNKRRKTFQKLMKACHEEDAYSVPMMCTKANISYAQIQAWAQEDEMWAQALQFCRGICEDNAEVAALFARMPVKEMIPFMGDLDYS